METIERIYTRIPNRLKLTFVSSFLLGLLIHAYKFTNNLPSHDSLINNYSSQNIIGSGRWFLSIACSISSFYDLPWVNGIISLIMIALTTVMIVKLLNISNKIAIVLVCGMMASFPSVTETYFFEFTADGYFLAMLFSAVASYLTQVEETKVWKWIVAGVLLCISCGIYQAYISFAMVMSICALMLGLLDNRWDTSLCLKWILKQVLLYAAALSVYFIIWKLLLALEHVAANNYQGISQVGTLQFSLLLNGIKKTIVSTIAFFIQWDMLRYGFTIYGVLNILFLFILLIGLSTAVIRSAIIKRKKQLVLFIIAFLSIFPCTFLWAFTSNEIIYRTMMEPGMVFLYIIAVLVYERYCSDYKQVLASLLIGIIICHNSTLANIGYYYLNLSYEQTYAEAMKMSIMIDELNCSETGFSDVAVIERPWEEVKLKMIDENEKMLPAGSIYMWYHALGRPLPFHQSHVVSFLNTYFDMGLTPVSKERQTKLEKTEDVQAMPIWPCEGSIKVIEGTLVIKLADTMDKES